jgi:hypothetical protein
MLNPWWQMLGSVWTYVVGLTEQFIAGAPVELWFRWFAVGIVIETALNYRNRRSLHLHNKSALQRRISGCDLCSYTVELLSDRSCARYDWDARPD